VVNDGSVGETVKFCLHFNRAYRIFTVFGMIKSINHKGLKLLWTKGDASKLPPEQVHRIRKVLNMINYLEDVPKDLQPFQNLRPHLLKGELKDFWSLDISGNYRIVFKFIDGNAYDLDYLDTH
jgi:proteic killer suppression protein